MSAAQEKAWAIQTREHGDPDWHWILVTETELDALREAGGDLPKGEDAAIKAFETKEEAEEYVRTNEPEGYETRVVQITMDLVSYTGAKDS
jgi:hypothetical protein